MKISDSIKELNNGLFLHTEIFTDIEYGKFFCSGKCIVPHIIVMTISNSKYSEFNQILA